MTDRQDIPWRISSYSSDSWSCVEVAPLDDGRVGVRHSFHPDAGVVVCGAAAWQAFTAGIRAGDFDA